MVLSHWIHFKESLPFESSGLPQGCMACGGNSSKESIKKWMSNWSDLGNYLDFYLVLAGSKTAEINGISAAGLTPSSRRFTALADAECLLKGPQINPRWQLPPLPAGFSPALISFIGSKWLNLQPQVISAGLFQQPDFPHISMESPLLGPSECLSSGKAMDLARVINLLEQGYEMGKKNQRPLVISECVPGGTTTAQAVMTGLGIPVADWMGSSMRTPPVELKKKIINKGLEAAELGEDPSSEELIAALGDPFQPIALGLLLGAREIGQPVLLGGGSQMLAVLALALRTIDIKKRSDFLEGVSIATTNWLFCETISSQRSKRAFLQLIMLFERHFNVAILALCSGLRFHRSTNKVLRDYEMGFIKEGVGAGAISLLAQLNGATCKELVKACDHAINSLSEKK